ncbi:MAG: cytochrome c biogenesis protein/redoxin [Clostridium sp.]|nr:cytochrome c biogenesis protein/redoxin [Clostridium sp.]
MDNIKIFVVFIEGILSVFSPCVLPILPVYISMLANSSISNIKDSKYEKRVLIVNAFVFALGIGTTFFILGSSMNAFVQILNRYKNWIMIIGGAIVFIMGVFYLDIIKIKFLMRERKFRFKYKAMSPLSAFVLGFSFSFGWTPCIGPILSSVLVLASNSENIMESNILILFYTLGFVLPFLITAVFYNKLYKRVEFLKKHMDFIKGASGIVIVLIGAFIIVGGMQNIAYEKEQKIQIGLEEIENDAQAQREYNEQKNNGTYIGGSNLYLGASPADFKLYDQNGEVHTLTEYKGKTVFLNFWATWCGPCRGEMPYIQELYEKYGENNGDVIILGISTPNLRSNDSKEEIIKFISNNGYDFPTVIDEKAEVMHNYNISAFPSTYVISREGNIVSFIPGALEKEDMERIIENAKENY